MMRKTLSGAFLFAALTACGGTPSAPAPEPAPVPEAPGEADEATAAAAIAHEVEANPDDYAAILEKHGTTAADFEASLYRIARDPDLTAKYKAAMQ